MTVDAGTIAAAAALVAVLAVGLACWWRARTLLDLRVECERLRHALADKESALARTLARCDELQAELGALHEKLGQDETRIEQLRDLVKVHVARRREFDEWASPIRASLGEAIGHTLRALKEQVARQEFTLRRQERLVAEAEAHYRSKQEELEALRRELTLKNYHIAALNERFIRVEERMQELTAKVASLASADAASVELDIPPSPADTERFDPGKAEARDWMEVLDNWHRRLHDRLQRMDALQEQLRAAGARGNPQAPAPGGSGGTGAA